MFFAVREGHIDTVRTLLMAGVEVNEILHRVKDEPDRPVNNASYKPVDDGMSPLLMAVRNGHFELAVALVEAGADPNDQRTGFTPLHTMAWVRKPDASDRGDPAPIGSGNLTSLGFVREMVALGADVNARLGKDVKRPPHTASRLGREGATPFFMAADRADAPLMRQLLDLGADPSLPNAANTTPLMAAAGLGTNAPSEEAGTDREAQRAVKLLLDLGADLDAVDDQGNTAMHGAAFGEYPGVVELLGESGANCDIWSQENELGLTPLFIAEGFRVINFKRSRPTLDAVTALMIAEGISLEGPRPAVRDAYAKRPEKPVKK
jgi:ankyrin repeat protein